MKRRMTAKQRKYFGKRHGKVGAARSKASNPKHRAKAAAPKSAVRVGSRAARGSTSLSLLGIFLSMIAGVGGGFFLPELAVEKLMPGKSTFVKGAVELGLGAIPAVPMLVWGGPILRVGGASLIVGDLLGVVKKQVKSHVATRAGLLGLGFDIYEATDTGVLGYLPPGVPRTGDESRALLLAGEL